MNKTCARCEKTVYPTEELKCLDKVWHKGCFKCQGCSMTLNMRTYKGFNKQPYCEAHIPKAKATTMAETPELKRIAENTKIQSNVKYHADFEKSKGKFTQVADDPETLRIKQNSKIISNVAYHGELEKKAIMEQKRTINENGEYVDVPDDNIINANHNQQAPQYHQPPPPQHQQHHQHVQQQQQHVQQQQQQHVQQQPQHVQQSQNKTAAIVATPLFTSSSMSSSGANSQIGKISDYDPLNNQPRDSPYSARQNQTVIYTSDRGAVNNPPTRKIGSIADIDPINNVYGSLSNPEYRNPNHNQYHGHGHGQGHGHGPGHQNQQQQQQAQYQQNHVAQAQSYAQQPHAQQPQAQQQHAQQSNAVLTRVYRAMYDYESQDSDEVSFCEGDLIVNVSNIDSGWMTGTVKRTGDTGMLPANYVEELHI